MAVDGNTKKIWRIQTNTNGKQIGKFCYENSIAAMGWTMCNATNASIIAERSIISNFDDYSKWYQKWEGKVNSNVSRLANMVEEDDLIWMRDDNHMYYLGRVVGPYTFNPQMVLDDACNQVPVEWHKIGNDRDGEVPGAIISAFIQGYTLQQIHKDEIKKYSQILYNQKAKKEYYSKVDLKMDSQTFFSLLSNDDCEDLLYFFLYEEYGFICIPSTNKKGSKTIEYEMIDPQTGKHAFTQVKQTNDDLNAGEDQYKKLNSDIYFLSTRSKVINIMDLGGYGHDVKPDKVYDFAFSDKATNILSNPIKNWIEFFVQSQGVAVDSNGKGVMFDTDSMEHEADMLKNSKVSAYGRSSRYVDSSFNKGDYVLYYGKGRGIIAVGKIIEDSVKGDDLEDEKYRDVEMIYPKKNIDCSVAVTPAEIKEIAGHGFFYASTIKSPFVDSDFVERVIVKLKAKYEQ